MRYATLTLYLYRWPHFEPVCTVRRRSAYAIERAAEKLLAPHTVETTRDPYCYHRDTARGAFVRIRRGARLIGTRQAEIRIVPSVGDLGVTP